MKQRRKNKSCDWIALFCGNNFFIIRPCAAQAIHNIDRFRIGKCIRCLLRRRRIKTMSSPTRAMALGPPPGGTPAHQEAEMFIPEFGRKGVGQGREGASDESIPLQTCTPLPFRLLTRQLLTRQLTTATFEIR